MKVLVTGGAGFIGRWAVKAFLDKGHNVIAVDNLSNGSMANIAEFSKNSRFRFIEADIRANEVKNAFSGVQLCVHMAAQVDVQKSIDNPEETFQINVIGTQNILTEAKKAGSKLVIMGTCMVYDAASGKPIDETHPTKPASPYAASKLAADEIAMSYFLTYKMPIIVIRPFNTYGPYQKTNQEGGVVGVFINRDLQGKTLDIFGSGNQTRDLLYVEDCAEFIYLAATSENAIGSVINAGSGRDVSINALAALICKDKSRIKNVPHHHPQSEIMKLVCDYSRAKQLFGWEPKTSLEEGISKTREWVEKNESSY